MTNTLDERLLRIFAHYGEERQLAKLAEECTELATAALHVLEGRHDVDSDEFLEELADVIVMTRQFYLHMDDVAFHRFTGLQSSKVSRQLERIEIENRR